MLQNEQKSGKQTLLHYVHPIENSPKKIIIAASKKEAEDKFEEELMGQYDAMEKEYKYREFDIERIDVTVVDYVKKYKPTVEKRPL